MATTPGVTGTQSPVPMSCELTAQPTPTPMPRWNLGEKLGRGGCAEVFLITNSSKRAVLKVAHKRPDMKLDKMLRLDEMIREERELLNGVGSHPNIVELVTLDADNEKSLVKQVDDKESGGFDLKIDRHGLALSFCDLDLFALLTSSDHEAMPVGRGEGYSLQTVFKLAEDMLSGLAHIHAAGILHRDIKPENILLTVDKLTKKITAKLADFGLAVDSVNAAKNTENWPPGTVGWSNPDRYRRWCDNEWYREHDQADKASQIDTEYDDVWAVMHVIRLLVLPNNKMHCFINTEGPDRYAEVLSFANIIIRALRYDQETRKRTGGCCEKTLAGHLTKAHQLISPWMFEVDGPCHEMQKNSFKMLLLTMLLSIDGLPKFDADVDGEALAERWKLFGEYKRSGFVRLNESLSEFFMLKSRSPEEDRERDRAVAKKALRMFERLSDKELESRPVETAGPGQAAPSV